MAWHGMAWQLYEKSGSYEHSDFDVGAELVRAIEMQANGLTPPGLGPVPVLLHTNCHAADRRTLQCLGHSLVRP